MDWFGRKRREQDLSQMQEAILKLTARLTCTESLICAILLTEDPQQRERVLAGARAFAVQLGDLKPPHYVQEEKQQDYRNEVSRALQAFIENTSKNSN
jgi:hypothetical protein